MNGGRFDFDDGGTYCGGWEEGKAHGHGVCTGPQGKGEYAGAWHYGFEVSGVYTWPSGNTYAGQWQNGKRHGLGVEQRGRWVYRGEWTQGLKGRYGHRQAINSQARYQGTWSGGFHDGYGTETYVDGGVYEGQWLRGMRHGYGIRRSALYGVAAKFRSRPQNHHASLTSLRSEAGDTNEEPKEDTADKSEVGPPDDGRGGFVLKACSQAPSRRRRSLSERSLAVKRTILTGLRLTKQHSTGDIHQRTTSGTGSIRSSGSTMSCTSDEGDLPRGREHFVPSQEEHIEPTVTEAYRGEWKNDKRSGFGVCDRSDGLKYEGEWFNNKKYGYGATTFKTGKREEGKYKNNVLVSSSRKKGLLFVRSSKLKERVEAAVDAAQRAAQIAQQKCDIAISRHTTAGERADRAVFVASQAHDDSDTARIKAKQFDPKFHQPGTDVLRSRRHMGHSHTNHVSFEQQPPSRYSQLTSDSQQHSMDSGDLISDHLISNFAQVHHGQQAPPPASSSSMAPSIAGPSLSSSPPSTSDLGGHVDPLTSYSGGGGGGGGGGGPSPASRLQPSSAQSQSPVIGHNQSSVPEKRTTETTRRVTLDEPSTASSQPASPAQSRLQPNHVGGGMSPAQSGSRMSLSDDHFDQYMMEANPNQARLFRRNRPSLTHQPENIYEGGAQLLNRRSTLATAHDRRLEELAATAMLNESSEETRCSLPDLTQLEHLPLQLRREEAARLASRQRQEMQRLAEEDALLRHNPLRYLFRPAFKAWLVRWKVPLLLGIANVCLFFVFYQLLTYDKRNQR